MDVFRETGRTFRMLLRAIIAASDAKPGKMVAVISASDDYAFDLQKHSAGVIGSYLHSNAYKYDSRDRTIQIVGAGTLKFTTEKWLNQHPYESKHCDFIYDHYTGQ